jgi:hypothetical protein
LSFCPQPDIAEKYVSAAEYGSTPDGHPEVPETKDGNDAMPLSLVVGKVTEF